MRVQVARRGVEKGVPGKVRRHRVETRIKGLFLRLLSFQKGRRNCATPLKVKTKQVLRDLRVFLIVVHQSRFSLLIQ